MKIKTYIAFFLLCGVCLNTQGQVYKAPNYKKFDDKFFHFGFTLGTNLSNVYAIPASDWSEVPDLLRTTVKRNPGFNLGFIGSVKLGHPTLTLRFVPSLSFQAKQVNYFYHSDPNKANKAMVESAILDFPLLLKYKTLRYNNFAAYFIGGAQYSLDLQSKQKVPQNPNDPFLKLRRHDFQAQIGAGVDFYLPFFKFGFEVKMSHGFINSLIQDNTRLSLPFDRFYNRVVWFSLTFEG